jgi:cell division protein FtsI/penicillin-binding protein 2
MKKRKKVSTSSTKYISTLRFYTVVITFLILGIIIFMRLFWLQVKKHDYYTALATKQYQIKKELQPQRGEIFLKGRSEKFAVAVNKEMPTVFVVPNEIDNSKEVVQKLTTILDLDESEVKKRVYKENDPYEVIKKKISQKEFEKLKAENMKGVHFKKERWRYYPGNELAAQTIGFLGYNSQGVVGRYGLEQYFNDILSGKKGFLEEDRDVLGRWISIGKRSINPSRDGSDLILSLDQVIQFKTELALKNAIKKHGADGGKIIIIDVKTGKILAMSSQPSFNPNKYSQFEAKDFRNPIVSDNYEPGSVFKIITMAAGLDAGRVSPGTTYNDTGLVRVNGFDIKNSDEKAYGQQTMIEVIDKSLNTGVIFVEKLLGHNLFSKYVKKFGFGEKSGIELPGETAGNINNLKTKRDVEFFTAAFGQGISVTPLQLAMAYGAIANKGVLLKPLILDKIINHGGQEKIIETREVRRVISRGSAKQASLMLESNVQNGHGKLAGVPGYRVAGKTGTAQIPDQVHGGYIKGATIGTFAGFAPVDNPIFAMVVIIDHPRDVEWAAGTAAPVFGELTKFLLDYYSVRPTEKYTKEDLISFDKKHNYLKVNIDDLEEKNKNESKDKILE